MENVIDKNKLDTLANLKLDPDKAKEVLAEYGYTKSTEIKNKDFAKIFGRLKEIT